MAFQVSSVVPDRLKQQFRKDWEQGYAPMYVAEEAETKLDDFAATASAADLAAAFATIRKAFQRERAAYCEEVPHVEYDALSEEDLSLLRQRVEADVPVARDVLRSMPGMYWMLTCCEFTAAMNEEIKSMLKLRARIEAGELNGGAVVAELEAKNKAGMLGNVFETLPYRPGKYETAEGEAVHVKDIREALKEPAAPPAPTPGQ